MLHDNVLYLGGRGDAKPGEARHSRARPGRAGARARNAVRRGESVHGLSKVVRWWKHWRTFFYFRLMGRGYHPYQFDMGNIRVRRKQLKNYSKQPENSMHKY